MHCELHALWRIRRVHIHTNLDAMLFQMPPGVPGDTGADSCLSLKAVTHDQSRIRSTKVVQALAWNILNE